MRHEYEYQILNSIIFNMRYKRSPFSNFDNSFHGFHMDAPRGSTSNKMSTKPVAVEAAVGDLILRNTCPRIAWNPVKYETGLLDVQKAAALS